MFDIVGFELEEFTKRGKSKSIIKLNAKYFAQLRLQESQSSSDIQSTDCNTSTFARIRKKISNHPALHGSSRYSFNSLSESSLFLSPRVLKNTRFLLDLMYRENLRSYGFVDENGQPLERIIASWLEDQIDSDEDIGLDLEEDSGSDDESTGEPL